LTTSLREGPIGGSNGSGVDIFIESGDCDLECNDSGGWELKARAFLIADGPSGIDDRGGSIGLACGSSVMVIGKDSNPRCGR
jgi:hypothetical protein